MQVIPHPGSFDRSVILIIEGLLALICLAGGKSTCPRSAPRGNPQPVLTRCCKYKGLHGLRAGTLPARRDGAELIHSRLADHHSENG